ncbi:hypothetical protein AZI86_08185 [Bdellovibrio bacteriovorus]|uniref:Uncharacterized protein n=1 Tax=Bdellovibrio bacteriovorus TaxID=959 RepID=A0A150WR75_BDEBC|nr:hypothetical protein [Bdellovibrio bacteriovorus]KYG66991.1 hypothetical protein AZI86_08185 [Bdellovibrio bacteriovorus]
MKKFVLVSVLSLIAATQAHASKARIQALQKAEFLKDSQTVFENPAHVNSLGKYLTMEMGGTTNTSAPKAEGGLFADEFGANMGVYVGHLSPIQQSLRAGATASEGQNNPVEVFYAKDGWGASVALSNFEDKTTDVKEQYLALRYGIDKDGMELSATVEAIAVSETATDKTVGAPYVTVNYEREMGTSYFFSKLAWGSGKREAAAGDTNVNDIGAEVGILSRKIKNVYYGASLSYAKREIGKDITAMNLPIFAGVEADLTSWSVVRASISQSFLLSNTQDKNQTAPADAVITNKNDTTVAAGLGLKYNNFALDGVVAGSTTGSINGNDVLTQASITYNF